WSSDVCSSDLLVEREAGEALDALEAPSFTHLARRARIGGFPIGLRATAKPEEVVVKPLVVRVDLRPALVAHALVPRATRVDAVVFRAPRPIVVLVRDDLVHVAR